VVQALSGSFLGWASTIDQDAVTERGLEIGCDEVILHSASSPSDVATRTMSRG